MVYHPTSRVLTVLELLQAYPSISGPQLASRLEVDVRTIRRYIAMLQDLGIPIEAVTGRYGGYALRPGFKLPPLMFTDDEALALALGLQAARRLGLAAATPAIEGALAKLERVLPAEVRTRIQALQSTLVVDMPSSEHTVESATVGLLSLAARQERQVCLLYTSGGKVTRRVVNPYGVVCHQGRWYLIAHCTLRTGLRVFRLDRVQQAVLEEGRFERPEGFDCLAYLFESIAIIPDRWNIVVEIDITIEEARRRLPPTLVLLEQRPDSVWLRSSIHDLDMIARVLVGLGCRITVHEPPELRDALRRLAAQVMQYLADSPPAGR